MDCTSKRKKLITIDVVVVIGLTGEEMLDNYLPNEAWRRWTTRRSWSRLTDPAAAAADSFTLSGDFEPDNYMYKQTLKSDVQIYPNSYLLAFNRLIDYFEGLHAHILSNIQHPIVDGSKKL